MQKLFQLNKSDLGCIAPFFLRLRFCLLTIGLCLGLCSASFAGILVPTGLNAGDAYRLAFVTSTIRDATSSNIADYNAFVQIAGDTYVTNNGGAVGDISWTAIASTTSINARTNTLTRLTDTDAAIYNLDDNIIAINNADLWDGTISANLLSSAIAPPPSTSAWTGTLSTGITSGALGTGLSTVGITNTLSSAWMAAQLVPSTVNNLHSFYAISEVLIYQSVNTPEPTTLALLSLGLFGLGFNKRKRLH